MNNISIDANWVSQKTTTYLSSEIANSLYGKDDSISKRIENSIRMLMNSIAQGVRYKKESMKFELTNNEQFLEIVINAILFRIPVENEREFIHSLYQDFYQAVSHNKITHDDWKVSLLENGTIAIIVFEKPEKIVEDKNWKKAKAIRLSDLKSETLN